jgi:hypothetical protein
MEMPDKLSWPAELLPRPKITTIFTSAYGENSFCAFAMLFTLASGAYFARFRSNHGHQNGTSSQ